MKAPVSGRRRKAHRGGASGPVASPPPSTPPPGLTVTYDSTALELKETSRLASKSSPDLPGCVAPGKWHSLSGFSALLLLLCIMEIIVLPPVSIQGSPR